MKAIRLQRFRAFEDSGWIEFKPITLLFGYNSAGKSTILKALLMLKQSIENNANEVPFVFSSDKGVDLGAFDDVIFQNKIDHAKPMIISMKLDVPKFLISALNQEDERNLSYLWANSILERNTEKTEIEYSVKISYNQKRRVISILGFNLSIKNESILRMDKKTVSETEKPTYYSDIIKGDLSSINLIWYNFIPLIKDVTNETKAPLVFLLSSIQEQIKLRLNSLVNIGPVRTKPERTMLFSGENPESVGSRGEDTFKLLYTDKYSAKTKNLEQKINKWLSTYNYKFEWRMLRNNYGQVVLKEKTDDNTKISSNIVDVGFGISQIFPIAVQLYVINPNEMLLVEQPEIHLHSRAQADFADLVIDSVLQEKKFIIIETHSESMLLRFRRRVVEEALDPKSIALYYITHSNGSSQVQSMSINQFGDIENLPEDFKKFFLDNYNDILSIHEWKGKRLKEGDKQ